jgi:hypothetical protein
MHLLTVAFVAIGWIMGHRWNQPDLMPKRGMTVYTFNLMVGHMFLMHELGGVLRTQQDRLVMTLHTFSLWDMAIALNHTEMAFLTRHPSRDILSVIEAPALDSDITFWLDMTGSATPYGARNALFFSAGTGFVIVADEAVDVVNREMLSLDKLTVA